MVEGRIEETGGDSSRDGTGSPGGSEPHKAVDDALGDSVGGGLARSKGGWAALRGGVWPAVRALAAPNSEWTST